MYYFFGQPHDTPIKLEIDVRFGGKTTKPNRHITGLGYFRVFLDIAGEGLNLFSYNDTDWLKGKLSAVQWEQLVSGKQTKFVVDGTVNDLYHFKK